MRKFFMTIVAAMLLLLFTLASVTSAHSVLESSNPKDGETLTRSISFITLTFDTKVEMESQFKITNQNGEEQKPDKVKRSGNSLEGIFSSPLKDGDYTVKWEIVGEDGHPVNGKISFQINKAKKDNNAMANNSNGTKENQSGAVTMDNNQTKAPSNTQTPVKKETEAKSSTFVIVLIAILLLIALIILLRLMKKKPDND